MLSLASHGELGVPPGPPGILAALAVAVLFAGIFLFGRRVAYHPGQKGRRRFLSFAAGISVAYIFVHLLPALHAIRELHTQSPDDFKVVFPEYSVYLWTMVGFVVFYGLDTLVLAPPYAAEHTTGDHAGPQWRPWLHISGFALYTWLLTYMMIWTGKGVLALALFAVAMGAHLLPISSNLHLHYKSLYDRRGAYVLALAALAGWACALTLHIPDFIVLDFVAFVAGGVVVNASIGELPKESEGRFGSFAAGAILYAAVLLTLSRFE